MATFIIFLVLLMAPLISSIPPKNQDLLVAMEEMQTANYFTYVMLLNMAPLDQRLQGNVTFLMPKDRMLAKAHMSQESILGFLLRHSIPSPMLLDHLEHVPSGSRIPSSFPGYMLKVSNNGRRNFFLNNVKIISPNICFAKWSSIRCHGIDGVLDNSSSLTTCPPAVSATPPFPSSSPSPDVPLGGFNRTPVTASSPASFSSGSQKSGSTQLLLCGGLLKFLGTLVTLVGLFV